MTTEEIKKMFFEETGLTAKVVSRISFNQWMIEAENGEIYHIH